MKGWHTSAQRSGNPIRGAVRSPDEASSSASNCQPSDRSPLQAPNNATDTSARIGRASLAVFLTRTTALPLIGQRRQPSLRPATTLPHVDVHARQSWFQGMGGQGRWPYSAETRGESARLVHRRDFHARPCRGCYGRAWWALSQAPPLGVCACVAEKFLPGPCVSARVFDIRPPPVGPYDHAGWARAVAPWREWADAWDPIVIEWERARQRDLGRAEWVCGDDGSAGDVQTGPKYLFPFLFPLIFSIFLFAKFNYKYILDFQTQIRCRIKKLSMWCNIHIILCIHLFNILHKQMLLDM
jgi:hypothetical protein